MGNIEQKINKLRELINSWNYQYYILNTPVVSDFKFDKKLKELEKLESQHPTYYKTSSPTQIVGSNLHTHFVRVSHNSPMLSLSNTYSKKEIYNFYDKTKKNLKESFKITCELKYDGVSISLIYKNGVLLRAATRGDGATGDDITANIKTIQSIPLQLNTNPHPDLFEIRGEVIFPWIAFCKENQKRKENGEPLLSNPRNATAGTLKSLNPQIVAQRKLDVFFYCLICDTLPYDSHYKNIQIAQKWGFKTSSFIKFCETIEQVFNFIDYWDKKKQNLPFAIDGIVLKVDSIRHQKALGATTKSPRWATAYKFQSKKNETTLLSVDFQVGRTGIITPVANLKSILLAGTIVKRASLHSENILKSLDLHVGDQCYVEKGGEIIPKIVGINKQKRSSIGEKIEFPQKCPSCKTFLKHLSDKSTYYCPNSGLCEAQIKGMIIHFVSRKAMNINIGGKKIEIFYKAGLIQKPSDIYQIKTKDIIKLGKWGEKSITKFMKSLQQSKQVPYERVLYALGIRSVGEFIAKTLAQTFPTIDQLIQTNTTKLIATCKIGEQTAQNIIQYFSKKKHIEAIKELQLYGIQFSLIKNCTIKQKLIGKIIVISGVFYKKSREEYRKLIEDNGGKNTTFLSMKTDFILAGKNIGHTKLQKANQLNIKILTEDEFLSKIEQNDKNFN